MTENLKVIDITAAHVAAITAPFDHGMRLTAMTQGGELQLMDAARSVALRPVVRMATGDA